MLSLVIRRGGEGDNELRFRKGVRRRICHPASGVQGGKRVQQRLHIRGIDWPASGDPLTLIVRFTDQSLFAIGKERQLVNLFRLEAKNR